MTTDVNRREFLFKATVMAGLGAVGAVFAWIFGNVWTAASKFSAAGWVQIAPLETLPPDSVTPFPEHKIAIIRSSRKIGAISMECTHLGCLLNILDRGFFCPCHGSEFGPRGQVYSGPATAPLPWHDLVNHEGRIWAHVGEKVTGPRWLEVKEPVHDRETRNLG
jgi:nitrite reductase/ring-hydroxylating ferredoxin subunit